MRINGIIVIVFLAWAAVSLAEMGFDPKYERDYNIFIEAHERRATLLPIPPDSTAEMPWPH